MPQPFQPRCSTELKHYIFSNYNRHCVVETYPKDPCGFYKMHQCSEHINKSKPSVEDGHYLRVEGPGLCNICRQNDIIQAMEQAFFHGQLQHAVKNQHAEEMPGTCTMTGWRCTNCETVAMYALKMCSSHDGRNSTFAPACRSYSLSAAQLDEINNHIKFEVGMQPVCFACPGLNPATIYYRGRMDPGRPDHHGESEASEPAWRDVGNGGPMSSYE